MEKIVSGFYKPEGYDIPGRQIMAEALQTIVTGQQFMEWMAFTGEDYTDQIALTDNNFTMFRGFLLHKYGWIWAPGILDESRYEALAMQDLYEDEDGPTHESSLRFYNDFADFIDIVGGKLKAQTNANLILVKEHYNK